MLQYADFTRKTEKFGKNSAIVILLFIGGLGYNICEFCNRYRIKMHIYKELIRRKDDYHEKTGAAL